MLEAVKWIGSIIAAILVFIVMGSLFAAASGAIFIVSILIFIIVIVAFIATTIKISMDDDDTI